MSSSINSWPTPLAAAKAILAAHPALVSLDAAAADIVAEAIDNASGLSGLATAISKQGPASPTGGWATLREVGTVGQLPATEYDLSDATRQAASPVLTEVIQTTQNDPRLEGVLWFAHPASAGGYRPVQPTAPFTWELVGVAPRYGVLVSSVAFDSAAGAWRLRLGNTAPRMLSVYVEFLDAAGNPLTPAGWTSRLPAGVDPGFETATRKYLGLLLPTRRIEGIAVPQDDAVFDWTQPAGAAETRITFGGLAAEPWDAVASPLGAIVTSVLGYAVPAILVAAGVSPDGWYDGLLTSEPIVAEVMAAGAFLLGTATTAAAYQQISSRIGGLMYGGLPKLTAALLQHLTDQQLADAAAAINWAPSTLAVTVAPADFSGSVLGSPSSFSLSLTPGMVGDLQVDLVADPAHGAWPATASRYTVKATWQGGSATADGEAQGLITPSPLAATLPDIPANRAVTLEVTVKDATGQARAQGTAVAPTPGPSPRAVAVTLAEDRPALGASTRFAFSLNLAWNRAKGHHWVNGPAPAATRRDLNGGSTGHNLAAVVGLQLGVGGRMLGYTWQASGQNLPFCGQSQPTEGQINAFQTLGSLASPEDGLEFPSCGFAAQPFLVFGPEGAGLDFYLDPRQGGSLLRRFTPGQPFDMSQSAPSYGRFNSSHLDDAVIHPDGYALAVSFRQNTFETLVIGDGRAGSPESVAGLTGGPGTGAGRFGGPVALDLTPGGDALVLENLNRRLQAVDPYGNPVPYFPGGQALLPLKAEASPVTYLDLAVDADGSILVLLYLNQGDAVSDYRLDLYGPDGTYLGGTPGVNAARIALDPWRNLYTLNYAHLLGPGGRTEPVLSVWTPQNS